LYKVNLSGHDFPAIALIRFAAALQQDEVGRRKMASFANGLGVVRAVCRDRNP